ncbi:MAG: rhomboid family intramembrane serine protease [Verrucomicrobiota bacterium]|jgi:GlpG protein
MRLIGLLSNESNARRFGDYLTSLEIPNCPEPEADGQWAVWVLSEDQLEAGRNALAGFLQNPNDSKYQHASAKATAMRQREQKEKSQYASRVVTSQTLWPSYAIGPLTIILIGICVAVALLLGLPPKTPLLWLSSKSSSLPEIHQGEVWRLITPIFIHMSIFHILFNMLWLKDLGSMIESRQGSFKLFLLVLVIGIGSNLGQNLVGGPMFGGMSGVLYGLFGYIWLRGKFDPASGLRLLPSTVVMMLGWFVLCVAGVIPYVANGAHGFGLGMGMIWGAAPPLAKKLLKS